MSQGAIAAGRSRLRPVQLAILAFGCAAAAAAAQEELDRSDFWDLRIGRPASEQPADFQEFACGTNGGPPSTPLASFADFATCAAEPGGLHEVQFRYDDEVEYRVRALMARQLLARYEGTKIFTYPVVVSALFDQAGVLRATRAVTDDRAPTNIRQRAFSFARYIRSEFGAEGWTCVELPAVEGEQPMGNIFVKEDCRKVTGDGTTVLTRARMLRKPGQSLIAPGNNQVRTGYFESIGRVDILGPGVPAPPADGDAG